MNLRCASLSQLNLFKINELRWMSFVYRSGVALGYEIFIGFTEGIFLPQARGSSGWMFGYEICSWLQDLDTMKILASSASKPCFNHRLVPFIPTEIELLPGACSLAVDEFKCCIETSCSAA